MSLTMLRRSSPVTLAVAAALGMSFARADGTNPPPPDTSDWKCEQCPFLQGYAATVEAGADYANGANASYGRYTGIDHNGAYADAGASGQWRTAGGSYGSYDLQSLGLASREGYVEAGQEGLFDVRLGYDGQPNDVYDTTATPFRSPASAQLTLPANWVTGNSTAGMTQLGASLAPVRIETDRRTISLLGEWFAAKDWTVYANLSHQEKTGTGITSGSFLTDAVQLAQPVDYVTNTVETGFRWTSRVASFHLSYSGSWFQDNTDSLTWQNPYLPIVPGSTQGQMALPPGNQLQQVLAGGEARLPLFQATLAYEASYGKLTQDQAFLPVSTLPGSPALPWSTLDGDVHISHYGLALSARPLSRLYLRGKVSYDGRDDHTVPLAIPYVVTDTFAGGSYVTPRYSEDRSRADGSADYRLFRWLRVGAAGEALFTHYSPGQVVTSTTNNRGWGYATVNPVAPLTFTLKAGNARRKAATFNTTALPVAENPLLNPYDYAPRDQNFFALSGSWAVTSSLTWALEGSWADDAYRLSQLGLQSTRDRRASTTVTWAPTETLSLYLDTSYQRIASLQNGSIATAAPVWQALDGEYFWTTAAGGHWQIHERWDLSLDYVRATTRGDTDIWSGGVATPADFPENRTQLDSVAFKTTWQWTKALKVRFRYAHETYHTFDWALENVEPATVLNLLSLGGQPFRHDTNVYSLTAIYQLGEREVAAKE
ncbi:MAG TPA: MtrB/PioB family decaheme-associated outer membrane protein [Steroidobacteraceae bacterium]|nr:MtrB/PioB family decaheme-associated outer membrane protein [Steroidobacteraceae bacterium]